LRPEEERTMLKRAKKMTTEAKMITAGVLTARERPVS